MMTRMFGFDSCAVAATIGGTDSAAASAQAAGHGFGRPPFTLLRDTRDRGDMLRFLRTLGNNNFLAIGISSVLLRPDCGALVNCCAPVVRRNPMAEPMPAPAEELAANRAFAIL